MRALITRVNMLLVGFFLIPLYVLIFGISYLLFRLVRPKADIAKTDSYYVTQLYEPDYTSAY